ncbi:AIG1-type G domain-containing protein [Fusarium falciforme]|uniref:AIG1-type G domain-containing protein n=1 Tax=Fusarium falciforme TaxID=195108 RepID=UPI002300363F|nr:AIG1-type G domain-containing protein [Fusarium falciforme]WAO94668.1 AIG1-type G domain-containing protein [Fusarium falciforme]
MGSREENTLNNDGQNKADGMSMIVVMGVTGSGKSYLINRLAGRQVVAEGGTLDSCTQDCQMVPANIGNSKVMLIDTPGFDDPDRPDADILSDIARVLAAQYSVGFELKGIIYIHRIIDVRYAGSSIKTFEIFKRICGEEALKNVLLVTSRWNEVDEATGADRERELRERIWAYMLGHGSCMSRFHGDRSSAVTLASQLLIKDPVVLRLQHEMIDEGKNLNDTTAGSFVDDGLEKLREEYLGKIEALENLKGELKESDRAMKRQMQAEWERERAWLRKTEEQQGSLRRDVYEEVRSEMQDKTETKPRGLKRLIPLIPVSLNLLSMFVGIAPGSIELLSEWFSDITSFEG